MRSALRLLAMTLPLLFAGCILPASDDDRFPQHNESNSQEYPNFENLIVQGTLSGGGESVTLAARARNEGPHTYKVSAICVPPWSDHLTSSLGDVHRTEPMGSCAAFGLKEFKPGESIPFEATWNGTLWDMDKNAFVDAAPGNYTWHLGFTAYKGGKESYEFESTDTIRVRFTVNVK